MKTSKNKLPLIVGSGVLVVAFVIVYLVIFPANNNPVSVNQPINMAVVAATSLDDGGNPVNPASVFSTKDKTIYVVVNLKNAHKNDIVSYSRYYKGKYINAQSARIVDEKANHVIFAFNKDKGYIKGKYDYKIFYNKKFMKSFTYNIN